MGSITVRILKEMGKGKKRVDVPPAYLRKIKKKSIG